jgi:hypothetical protein
MSFIPSIDNVQLGTNYKEWLYQTQSNELMENKNYNEVLISEEECCICFENFKFGVVINCGHIFCRDCVVVLKANRIDRCAYCRGPLIINKYVQIKTQEEVDYEKKYKEIAEKVAIRKEELLQKNINSKIESLSRNKLKTQLNEKINNAHLKSSSDLDKEKNKEMKKRAWKNKRGKR